MAKTATCWAMATGAMAVGPRRGTLELTSTGCEKWQQADTYSDSC